MREALESAVSPETAQHVLAEALERAALTAVPEEIEPFRKFCEGPFRFTVAGAMGKPAIEQVFERLGHVLWMATSDVTALETARAWSRGDLIKERDDDSGVRHVEPSERATPTPRGPSDSRPSDPQLRDSQPRGATGSQPRSATGSQPRGSQPDEARGSQPGEARGSQPGEARVPERSPSDSETREARRIVGESGSVARPPIVPSPPSPQSATLGRLRSPTLQQRATATTMEIQAAARDPRSASSPPPPRPPIASMPARQSSNPPRVNAPSSVLVLTLDPRLVTDLREELAGQCPVRSIGAPNELASAVITGGQRLVVLIDTALPSIDVPTFAGLAPILPAGSRVILWGASARQQQRLASMFPIASSWITSNGAPRAGRFILDL